MSSIKLLRQLLQYIKPMIKKTKCILKVFQELEIAKHDFQTENGNDVEVKFLIALK